MKKIFFVIITSLFLNGCFQVVAFITPAITGATTGNIYQSAISYSVSYGVKKTTGKTVLENIIERSQDKEKITKIKKNEKLVLTFYPNAFYYPNAFPKL